MADTLRNIQRERNTLAVLLRTQLALLSFYLLTFNLSQVRVEKRSSINSYRVKFFSASLPPGGDWTGGQILQLFILSKPI